MKSEVCCFCNKKFSNKFTLERHLSTNSCKASLLQNQLQLYNFVNSQCSNAIKNYKDCIVHDNSTNNTNNINIKIEITPISEISLKNEEALYEMIKQYSSIEKIKNEQSYKHVDGVKFIFSDFLKSQLCDPNNPEKQPIKYLSKNPPSYQIVEKRNLDGDIITIIRGLKDSVDILSNPVLDALQKALRSFEKILIKEDRENPEESKYDYPLYDITIKALKNELNKKNVQTALKQFLKHELLNNINMKMTISEKELV